MTELKKLQNWIVAFEKVNKTEPSIKAVKDAINEIINKTKKRTPTNQIFFRESQWSDYQTLRMELLKDQDFVKDYAGVDLQSYIDEALAWSEKGNKSTDLGWKLTLRNWMRNAKANNRLIMKSKKNEVKSGFVNP
jgi:hypothetical protein